MTEQVSYVLSLRDQLTPSIEKANTATNKLEGSINSLQTSLGGLASAFGIAFGISGIIAMGSAIVAAGTKVEDARVGLTTLLGDADEATRVITNTMQDAMKTPFAFEGLLSANKALISAGEGADSARTTVLNLSNAIAATGGGDDELQRMVVNLQQIRNVGNATAMDIKQFAFAGINIYKVLEEAGIKVKKGAEGQAITYDQIALALQKAHDVGGIYYNGLENMAGNTSVQISNLGDRVFQLSVQMFNDLKPAIDSIITGLNSFIGYMTTAWEWCVKNRDLLKDIGTVLVIAGGAWLTYKGIILGVTLASKAMVAWEYIQIASLYTTAGAAGGLSVWMTILTAAQWAFNAALTANPIGLIIAAIAALVAGVVWAYNKFEKFRATLWAVWATVKEFASIVGDAFSALWKIIHGVFTFDGAEIKAGFVGMTDVVLGAAERLGKAAVTGWKAGIDDFAADQKESTGNKDLKPKGKKATTKATGVAAAPETKTKATGSKSVTINVQIKDLIGTYNSNVTNVKEMGADIRAEVVKALTSAVNDFQIVAGS